jgi:hypothetical protein
LNISYTTYYLFIIFLETPHNQEHSLCLILLSMTLLLTVYLAIKMRKQIVNSCHFWRLQIKLIYNINSIQKLTILLSNCNKQLCWVSVKIFIFLIYRHILQLTAHSHYFLFSLSLDLRLVWVSLFVVEQPVWVSVPSNTF